MVLAKLGDSPDLISFPSVNLGQLIDSRPSTAKRDLELRGYAFLKNFLDHDIVLKARSTIREYMERVSEEKVWENQTEGILESRCGKGCVPFMEGRNKITTHPDVSKVVENPALFSLFHEIFGCSAKTFDFKWLRGMYRGGFTGAHVDNVYMSRGTHKTLTCWIPIDDVTIEKGGLAICEGSHYLPSFSKLHGTYSSMDIEAEGLSGTGWFSTNPKEITDRFGGAWKTSEFHPGDILLFGMKTVHMSLTNQTDFARISCDTRWYPGNENPDYRYVGDFGAAKPKFGVYGDRSSGGVAMDELKAKWGFE